MVPPPPPPLSDDLPCWLDEVWASPVDVRRRIFCNRSLNMQHIKVCILCRVQSALNMIEDRGFKPLDTSPYGALYDNEHIKMHTCCALLKLPCPTLADATV